MEQLMRELESKRQIDRASLFRVLINYQKHDSKPINATGLTFASWNVPYRNSESEALPTVLDLIFNLQEMSTMLTGTVNVRNEAVNGLNIKNAAKHFYQILEIMASHPNRVLSTLHRDAMWLENSVSCRTASQNPAKTKNDLEVE